MMNLMVVDDEYLVVEFIVFFIVWREFGIGQVYKVYLVKEVLQQMVVY